MTTFGAVGANQRWQKKKRLSVVVFAGCGYNDI